MVNGHDYLSIAKVNFEVKSSFKVDGWPETDEYPAADGGLQFWPNPFRFLGILAGVEVKHFFNVKKTEYHLDMDLTKYKFKIDMDWITE